VKKWPIVTREIENSIVKAQAPYIISASRASDIPAFYLNEFIESVEKGYTFSKNPFNGVVTPVVFDNCKLVVFWSKYPKPLLKHIHSFKKKFKILIHYTLNDYDLLNIEKGVPSVMDRITLFQELSDIIGPENIIWRNDPILVSDSISISDVIEKSGSIAESLKKHTERVVFSFIKINRYKRVAKRINRFSKTVRELNNREQETYLIKMKEITEKNSLEFTSCGTPGIYTNFGVSAPGCISYSYLQNCKIDDIDFQSFYLLSQPTLFQTEIPKSIHAQGQQPHCNCIQSKDIGRYNTCRFGCVYCYANN
jgi:hypothetical protein